MWIKTVEELPGFSSLSTRAQTVLYAVDSVEEVLRLVASDQHGRLRGCGRTMQKELSRWLENYRFGIFIPGAHVLDDLKAMRSRMQHALAAIGKSIEAMEGDLDTNVDQASSVQELWAARAPGC